MAILMIDSFFQISLNLFVWERDTVGPWLGVTLAPLKTIGASSRLQWLAVSYKNRLKRSLLLYVYLFYLSRHLYQFYFPLLAFVSNCIYNIKICINPRSINFARQFLFVCHYQPKSDVVQIAGSFVTIAAYQIECTLQTSAVFRQCLFSDWTGMLHVHCVQNLFYLIVFSCSSLQGLSLFLNVPCLSRYNLLC